MIPRYTREEIGAVWSDEHRFETYLKVEIAVCRAWNRRGVISDEDLRTIEQQAKIDLKRIKEIEEVTHHDLIAFVEQVGERIGNASRYFHYGLTSSDIIDTAESIRLVHTGKILSKGVENLTEALRKKALEYKELPSVGRTHGIHAEPITLGFKFAGWYFEMKRNLRRLEYAVEEVRVGKISGAVGTYAHLDPSLEEDVCHELGLKSEDCSTQIIPRDRHGFFLSILAIIASSLERIALQIRLLQQTELSELAEPFGKGQKGSSAMPHKRNPILCERICGLARIIKKNGAAGFDNVALWHERDISHSSAERILLPESSILLDYLLEISKRVIENLEVFPLHIAKNLASTQNLLFSQRILLALCDKGVPRKKAYEIVQKYALKSYQEGSDFKEEISSDTTVASLLSPEELKESFEVSWFLRNLKAIFQKLQ
ncbi:MAG: adenylosuccinate lyase [Candidatus Ratteibacteria bacterium]